jgi:hypothetical protein
MKGSRNPSTYRAATPLRRFACRRPFFLPLPLLPPSIQAIFPSIELHLLQVASMPRKRSRTTTALLLPATAPGDGAPSSRQLLATRRSFSPRRLLATRRSFSPRRRRKQSEGKGRASGFPFAVFSFRARGKRKGGRLSRAREKWRRTEKQRCQAISSAQTCAVRGYFCQIVGGSFL